MRKKKKKGISPLIATVLIIGFTIVIASMVMIWGGDIFQKYKSQTETESLTKLTCVTKLNLNIKEACDLGTSIRVRLENLADQEINSFIYRAISPSGAAVKIKNEKLSPFGSNLFYLYYYAVDEFYTKPNKIEILPRILIDGKEQTCPGTSKEIKPCYVLPSLNNLADWTFDGGTSGLIKDNPDALKLLKSKGINDEIGVYLIGSADLKIKSNEFLIPPEAKYFFIRVLSYAGEGIEVGGNINYKLIVKDDKTYSDSTNISVGDVVIGRKFLLENSENKIANIEVTKTGGGAVGITNIGYILE